MKTQPLTISNPSLFGPVSKDQHFHLLQKLLAFVGIVVVMLLSGSPAMAVEQQDPYRMVQQVAKNTFAEIEQDQALIAKDPNHLKTIVREQLMPYVDYRYASLRILYKVKATKAEKAAFFKAFEQYLVTTYATIFAKYDKQKVLFAPAEPFAEKKIVEVKTRLVAEGAEDLNIDFKVRKNKKTGQWKAYDLKAQGVSLLDSKRAELIGMLRQENGVARVTALLTEKAASDIQLVTKSASK